jgi:hypothetical protein
MAKNLRGTNLTTDLLNIMGGVAQTNQIKVTSNKKVFKAATTELNNNYANNIKRLQLEAANNTTSTQWKDTAGKLGEVDTAYNKQLGITLKSFGGDVTDNEDGTYTIKGGQDITDEEAKQVKSQQDSMSLNIRTQVQSRMKQTLISEKLARNAVYVDSTGYATSLNQAVNDITQLKGDVGIDKALNVYGNRLSSSSADNITTSLKQVDYTDTLIDPKTKEWLSSGEIELKTILLANNEGVFKVDQKTGEVSIKDGAKEFIGQEDLARVVNALNIGLNRYKASINKGKLYVDIKTATEMARVFDAQVNNGIWSNPEKALRTNEDLLKRIAKGTDKYATVKANIRKIKSAKNLYGVMSSTVGDGTPNEIKEFLSDKTFTYTNVNGQPELIKTDVRKSFVKRLVDESFDRVATNGSNMSDEDRVKIYAQITQASLNNVAPKGFITNFTNTIDGKDNVSNLRDFRTTLDILKYKANMSGSSDAYYDAGIRPELIASLSSIMVDNPDAPKLTDNEKLLRVNAILTTSKAERTSTVKANRFISAITNSYDKLKVAFDKYNAGYFDININEEQKNSLLRDFAQFGMDKSLSLDGFEDFVNGIESTEGDRWANESTNFFTTDWFGSDTAKFTYGGTVINETKIANAKKIMLVKASKDNKLPLGMISEDDIKAVIRYLPVPKRGRDVGNSNYIEYFYKGRRIGELTSAQINTITSEDISAKDYYNTNSNELLDLTAISRKGK